MALSASAVRILNVTRWIAVLSLSSLRSDADRPPCCMRAEGHVPVIFASMLSRRPCPARRRGAYARLDGVRHCYRRPIPSVKGPDHKTEAADALLVICTAGALLAPRLDATNDITARAATKVPIVEGSRSGSGPDELILAWLRSLNLPLIFPPDTSRSPIQHASGSRSLTRIAGPERSARLLNRSYRAPEHDRILSPSHES